MTICWRQQGIYTLGELLTDSGAERISNRAFSLASFCILFDRELPTLHARGILISSHLGYVLNFLSMSSIARKNEFHFQSLPNLNESKTP